MKNNSRKHAYYNQNSINNMIAIIKKLVNNKETGTTPTDCKVAETLTATIRSSLNEFEFGL